MKGRDAGFAGWIAVGAESSSVEQSSLVGP